MSEIHILVDGGTVYCSQSVANNSPATGVPITVTSQRLAEANGGKPVATVKDETFLNMNFGQCNDPKYLSPPPCLAQVKWSKAHEGLLIDGQGLLPLTEESEGMCNVCSVPGQVKVAFHGQQAAVTAEAMAEAEPEVMEQVNPLAEPLAREAEERELELEPQGPEQLYATTGQIRAGR